MNAEPEFSILLPTHNRPDVLPFAIRSILGQTVADFELLVVGDGCTDQTAEIVQSFPDPRIQWFDLPKAPHLGYANRNIALRRARGRYIAYLPHDDLWLPDHLELLSTSLAGPGREWAYSRPLWVVAGRMIAPGTFNLEHGPTLQAFLTMNRNGIPSGCIVHRRECLARYGYWNEGLASSGDWDLWVRILGDGERRNFVSLLEPTCLHFRANWRTEATVMEQLGEDWQMLQAELPAIPAALRIPDNDRKTPQEIVWEAMFAEPREWTARVRAATRSIINRDISRTRERVAALSAQVRALTDQVDELNKRKSPGRDGPGT